MTGQKFETQKQPFSIARELVVLPWTDKNDKNGRL